MSCNQVWPPATTNATTTDSHVALADGSNMDAHSRLRVGLPQVRLSAHTDTDKRELFWNEALAGVGSSGTSVFDTNEGVVNLGVSVDSHSALRQTKEYFTYRAAQSQMIITSWLLPPESDALFIVRRTSTSGSSSDAEVIAQASWNLDPLDGTGPSGITLDVASTQTMVIDFQAMFVGRIRIGFDIGGVIYYAHQFLRANNGDTAPYWRRSKLPVRYQLQRNNSGAIVSWIGYGDADDGVFLKATGTAEEATTLKQIASSVIREGGVDEPSVQHEGRSNAVVNVTTAWETVLGLRVKSGNIRATIRMMAASLISLETTYAEFCVVLNPTFTGTPTWEDIDGDNAAEIARFNALITINAAGDPTAGHTYPLGGFALTSPSRVETSPSISRFGDTVPAAASIAGVADQVWLCARSSTGTADVRGLLSWAEER